MLKSFVFGTLSLLIAVPAWSQSGLGFRDSDQELAEIALENPGFGGYYVDEKGRAVLLVAGGASELDLASRFDPQDTKTEVITRKVAYDFATLHGYKLQARQMLSEPGVVYVDLDERNNRILVGVEQDPAKRDGLLRQGSAAAPALARAYSIPENALAIVETEPIAPLATLRSRIRPAPGGMQIINNRGGICTMGVVVRVGGINGFLTNSHCTNRQGGVENTLFYQPTVSSGNLIGTEVADPPYRAGGGCPINRVCRPSDSALVQFSGNNMALGEWGYIAKPPCSNCGNNINISTSVPRMSMVYNSRDFAVGDNVQKVGRTTGWTEGPVTNTCLDGNVAGTNITLLCQGAATLGSAGGDSGSAIIRGSLRFRRKLTGLLWGGAGSTTVFSTRDQIEADLGVVDTWP